MNKSQLIDSYANAHGITKAEAKRQVESVLDQIHTGLHQTGKVSLADFGTFTLATRAERQGRNPKTNESITIPAKQVVKFKAFDGLTKV